MLLERTKYPHGLILSEAPGQPVANSPFRSYKPLEPRAARPTGLFPLGIREKFG
jgi:hypothetical protein